MGSGVGINVLLLARRQRGEDAAREAPTWLGLGGESRSGRRRGRNVVVQAEHVVRVVLGLDLLEPRIVGAPGRKE